MKKTYRLIIIPALLMFTAAMAQGQVIIQGDLLREHVATPGETYSEEIILRNTSETAIEIKTYLVSYSTSRTGEARFDAPDVSPWRSNAGWISQIPSRFIVPPKVLSSVRFFITVPKTLPQGPGSYWSCLMVETIGGANVEAPIGIKVVQRTAIQLVTHIGDGTRRLKFLAPPSFDTAARKLIADVEGTGERMVRPAAWVELVSVEQPLIRPLRFVSGPKSVYPGSSVRFEIDLAVLGTGSYKARVFFSEINGGQTWVSEEFSLAL